MPPSGSPGLSRLDESKERPAVELRIASRPALIGAGIFIAAFLLRISYASTQPEAYRDDDERVYETVARKLLVGEGLILTPHRKAAFPPLYPLFLAGLAESGLPLFPAARLAQSLLGAVSCLLAGGVARLAFAGAGEGRSRIAGLLAAGLLAVYPMAVIYPARLMTENLFIILILAAVFCLLRSLSLGRTWFWLALGGALLGLGVLCRPTLLPFPLLAAAWLRVAPGGRLRYPVRVLTLLVPCALVLLPWQIRNYRVLGEMVPVTSAAGVNLYIANNPAATGGSMGYRALIAAGVFHLGEEEDEIAYNRFYRDKALEFIREKPGRFLSLALKRLVWFYHLDYHYRGSRLAVVFFHLMLVLAIAGMWLSRRWWRTAVLPALVIVNFTAVHMVFLPEGRYRLPLVPFLLAFAALAVVILGEWGKRKINARAGCSL